MRSRNLPLIFLIIVLAAAAGLFVYPNGLLAKFLPWRLGLDLIGGAHLIYEVDMKDVAAGDQDSVMNGLRDVIERRVNLFGVSEPQVITAKSGESNRLIVELAGIKDVSAAIKEIGSTPFLFFSEVDSTDAENPKFLPPELTGRHVVAAKLAFDNITSRAQVSLEFNKEGAEIFEKVTERNVGKPLAIFLDNTLIEMPTVQEKISGGQAQITGQFSVREARQLVERFNAGALPAPISLISQQTIGASLGANSLKKAIWAGIFGTLLIMIFMISYYRGLCIFAALALFIYVVLTLAVFKGVSMTMTLSGIAGFILSIGMAIDANILIFERTKEELRKGLPKLTAIEEGFHRAWTSIRDSNVTTIISSVILYYFTSSFVRGFALTLLIGVIMSMFSAITVTRTLLKVFTRS